MNTEERKRLLFLKRMALSHLLFCQNLEKRRIKVKDRFDLYNEFKELDKFISEIDVQLHPADSI